MNISVMINDYDREEDPTDRIIDAVLWIFFTVIAPFCLCCVLPHSWLAYQIHESSSDIKNLEGVLVKAIAVQTIHFIFGWMGFWGFYLAFILMLYGVWLNKTASVLFVSWILLWCVCPCFFYCIAAAILRGEERRRKCAIRLLVAINVVPHFSVLAYALLSSEGSIVWVAIFNLIVQSVVFVFITGNILSASGMLLFSTDQVSSQAPAPAEFAEVGRRAELLHL